MLNLPTHSRSGAIVGLVIITPACGYVDLTGAILMMIIGSPLCYLALNYRNPLVLDDAMDSFAIHGVGGVLGSLLTGFFANDDVTGDRHARGAIKGHWMQVAYQLCGVCAVAAWSLVMTFLILVFVDRALVSLAGEPFRLAASSRDAVLGLDWAQHGCKAEDPALLRVDAEPSFGHPSQEPPGAPQQVDVVIIPDAGLGRMPQADSAEAKPA